MDDELEAAVATLQSLATTLECSCVKLRERKDLRGIVAQYLIRRLLDQTGNSLFISGIQNIINKSKIQIYIFQNQFLFVRVAKTKNRFEFFLFALVQR